MAKQAAGSALVRFGDTMVLAAVTVSPNVSTLPFFPLTVEYREKTYAAGKIPGGFLKREGRPSDKEILACRLIDRSIRPLFPEGFKNEVQVFVTVLSADQENDADILGVIAASTALSLSPVPWNGPARRGARGPGRGQLDPQSDLPAARVLDHRSGRQRLGRLDRDGRGRVARGVRGRDPRGAQGGPEGDQGRDRARAPAHRQGRRRAGDGLDQGARAMPSCRAVRRTPPRRRWRRRSTPRTRPSRSAGVEGGEGPDRSPRCWPTIPSGAARSPATSRTSSTG